MVTSPKSISLISQIMMKPIEVDMHNNGSVRNEMNAKMGTSNKDSLHKQFMNVKTVNDQ